jgi:hypothetical protein
MSRNLITTGGDSRRWQAGAILIAALLQIAFARVTDLLHVGQSVEVRSALASHPLVPLGYAFIIWGAIYAYALVAALWQLGPKHRNNLALRDMGWQTAGIYMLNALWQVWVPLRGLDVVSVIIVGAAFALGLSSLSQVRDLHLSKKEEIFVLGPVALTTGWLTAATVLNITSALVAAHNTLINPMEANVSLIFLLALIAIGAALSHATRSLLYSLALIWALFWVMMANIYRDHDMTMASVALGGIVVIAAITGRQLYQSGHRGNLIHA